MEINKIYNMDCLDGMKKMVDDDTISLIVSDPPYGVDFKTDIYNDSKENVFNLYSEWLKEMYRVLKDGSHIYLFVPTLEVDRWVSEVKKYFKFNNLLSTSVYPTGRYLENNFCYDLQLVIYASKGTAKKLNKVDFQKTSNVWYKDKRNKNPKEYTYKYSSIFPKEIRANIKSNNIKKSLHPNQKNTDFIDKLILLSSDENDIVLDPFMGSGSTVVSSINTKRNFLGFELNTEIFNIANDRIQKIV